MLISNNENINCDNVIYRMRKFLEDKGIADSFRYIKSLDTIELVGLSDNGGERVLFNDIVCEYGEDIVWGNEGSRYLMPSIPEGVIKSRTSKGAIYYTHFRVINSTEEDFDLEIKEYHYYGSGFYLRYIITIEGIVNAIDESADSEVEVSYACIKQILLETFSDQELSKEFSKPEIEWISKNADRDDAELQREAEVIMVYTLSTFQAINFLSSYNKTVCNKKKRNVVKVINQEENYECTENKRIIDISKYYNVKSGKKNCESNKRTKRKIMRKTDKWIVSGHTRQYKSGKVVFVQAYYKGPNRKSVKKPKTTFVVNESN